MSHVKSILFVTTGLNAGGAERVLFQVLAGLDKTTFTPTVINLGSRGSMQASIESLGIVVHNLALNPKFPDPRKLLNFVKLVRQISPEIIQGWMYHGNLMALLASKVLVSKVPVFWSIHNSLHDLTLEKRMTRVLIKLGARFSSRVQAVIYPAHVSAEHHQTHGFAVEKKVVIPNGFDLLEFSGQRILGSDPVQGRRELRTRLCLPPEAFLVGVVGRFHPQKDQANFVKAALLLHQKYPEIEFLLCGNGLTRQNQQLLELIPLNKPNPKLHFLGERTNIPEVLCALDLFVNPSASEAFPLVLGEAMACGLPCIATDVGDSALLLGEPDLLVPSRRPDMLADKIGEISQLQPTKLQQIGINARHRIEQNFRLEQMQQRHNELYRQAVE